MRHYAVFVLTFLLMFFVPACFKNSPDSSQKKYQSTLYLNYSLSLKVCNDCKKRKERLGSGTGFIIKADEKGSYVLTASHVCKPKDLPIRYRKEEKNLIINLYDWEQNEYEAVVVKDSKRLDLCLLYSEGLRGEVAVMSKSPLRVGEKVYNISASSNIYFKGAMPFLEGLYCGNPNGSSLLMFSLPISEGASGSPVFNSENEVISMIILYDTRYSQISYGVHPYFISEFLEEFEKEQD